MLVQDSAAFHPGWFKSDLPTTDRQSWSARTDLTSERDVVILAETYLPGLPAFKPGVPKILLNQNGLTALASSASVSPRSPRFWRCTATPISGRSGASRNTIVACSAWGSASLRSVKRLVNGLEPQVRPPDTAKQWQVAYMPRKNRHDANVVTAFLQQQSWWSGWSLQSIENCSHAEVIATLQRSLVFLSFGHPEGFGLPVAEAMACGCAVVGYSGLGGRELFDLAAGYGLGVPVELGDWLGCVQGVERINYALRSRQDDVALQLDAMAAAVQQRPYSIDAMQRSVAEAIAHLDS